MIRKGEGDLLKADVEALVNTVNCVGVMGKGIALQFKRRYPQVFKDYEAACRRGDVRIGRMFVVPTNELTGPRFVINFPTKKHWRSPSKLAYIKQGLASLRAVIEDLGIQSVAIPPLGAGNGGLNWAEVEPLIREALDGMPVTVSLFAPTPGRRPVASAGAMRITRFRALLLTLIRDYVGQRLGTEPWESTRGASHLEIQKLAYFASLLEPDLKLKFAPGRYGPYSEEVRHALQDMEGELTFGLGDGTNRVLDNDPIELTSRGAHEIDRYMTSGSQEAAEVQSLAGKVMLIVDGFEGPYGLELLGSTQWAAKVAGPLPQQVAEAVRGWTRRKARLFTDQQIDTAMRHLDAVGLSVP